MKPIWPPYRLFMAQSVYFLSLRLEDL